jgi:hypothetical protein
MKRLIARSHGATVIVEWNPGCLRAAGADPVHLPELLEELGVRELSVLDDFNVGAASRLSDVRRQVANGETHREWVVNLLGTVR